MKWVDGPSLTESRHFSSGFIDEQDGSFHFYGGQNIWGGDQDTIDILSNDIDAEFVELSYKLPATYSK